jgi:putative addiction module component (TIGR02574 family)
MATDPIIDSVFQLSQAEKLQLVQDLWDDIAENPESIPVPDEQLAELERRRAALDADPSRAISWEVAKRMIRNAGNE